MKIDPKDLGMTRLIIGTLGVAAIVIALAVAFLSKSAHADDGTAAVRSASPTVELVSPSTPVQEEESYLIRKYHELKAWAAGKTEAHTEVVTPPTADATKAAEATVKDGTDASKPTEEQKKSSSTTTRK